MYTQNIQIHNNQVRIGRCRGRKQTRIEWSQHKAKERENIFQEMREKSLVRFFLKVKKLNPCTTYCHKVVSTLYL